MKKIILLLIGLVIVSCQDKKQSNVMEFSQYISGFSSGYIYRDDPVVIILTSEIPQEKIKKLQGQELVEMGVEGKTTIFANQIVFKPEKQLEADKQYDVVVNLYKIFDIEEDELKKFTFKVKTNKAKFKVVPNLYQSYDKNWYYLRAKVIASQRMSKEQVLESVRAYAQGKSLKIKYVSAIDTTTDIIIDSIETKQGEKIKIQWDGTKADMDSKGSITQSIPWSQQMTTEGIIFAEEDQKTYKIGFSQPLKQNQNPEGLVQTFLNDREILGVKYQIDGNILRVYSPEILVGKIKVIVGRGIEGEYGKTTEEIYTKEENLEDLGPKVEIISQGVVLPSSQKMTINFKTLNLKAVEVKVKKIYQNNVLQFLQDYNLGSTYGNIYKVGKVVAHKILPIYPTSEEGFGKWHNQALDLSNVINTEPGAVYNVEISIKKEFSATCANTQKIYEQDLIEKDRQRQEDGEIYDDYTYGQNPEDYNWNEKDNPCSGAYYIYNNTKQSINILSSDLGVIVKKGQDNHYIVVVNNIINTKPINGALVELYDYQRQRVGEGTTNSQGILNLKTKARAYFAVVKKEDSTTYIKIDDGNSLSVSNFNVSGVELTKGRAGMIYTERGVYRPGDSISVGFILNDYANKLPENHPIKVGLLDPYGKIIQQFVKNSTEENHYLFKLKLPHSATTGVWKAEIGVGASLFSRNIKVEMIKPNRLKIKNSLSDKTITSQGSEEKIQVEWLSGGAAKQSKVEVSAKAYQTTTAFKGFKDYVFDNVSNRFDTKEFNVFSGKTSDDGVVGYRIDPSAIENASGVLKINVITKVNEQGGDFSTDVCEATYSPYESYVGVKIPDVGDRGYLETEKKHKIELAVVSEKGEGISDKEVEVRIFKMQNSWWWDASYQNLSKYTSARNYDLVDSFKIRTSSQGKTSFQMQKKDDQWGGYFIVLKNMESGHEAGVPVYFDYGYGSDRKTDEATVISVGLDKTKYSIGEDVVVSFASSPEARAFISVENSAKVISTQWAETQKGKTSVKIPVTREMTPNAYVYVTYLQPHKSASKENDNPIRMYGIAGFETYDEKTKLEPVISCQDRFKPEGTAHIKIKEKNGRKMTYTIAVVEDGLLNLTRFKTPKPWDRFFAKTALGVKTWDMYNDVIGAFAGEINQVFAIGGDEELQGANTLKANRFKPFSVVKGPFRTNGGENIHKIQIPNYIGSARIMVVASDAQENAYGSAEKNVQINSPLMVLGSLPKKAVPQEKIVLPVTVFATDDKIKDVQVLVKTNDNLEVEGVNKSNVTFTQKGEKMAYFNLKVKKNGIGKVTIEVQANGHKAHYQSDISIYNPNQRVYMSQSIVLSDKQEKSLDIRVFGQDKTQDVKVEASSVAGVNLSGRLSYIDQYPHQGSQPIASKALCMLYMQNFITLSSQQKDDIQANVTAYIEKLHKNQLPEGGFSNWEDSKKIDPWVTSYVGLFLIDAQNKGFALPVGCKNNWINYQKNKARSWIEEGDSGEEQAYRLYTLAKAKKAEMGAMNKLRESRNLSHQAKVLLSGAYALSGQINIAKELFSSVPQNIFEQDNNWYSYNTMYKAMALDVAMILDDKKLAGELAMDISKELSSDTWLSVQSIAYGLYSMAKFAEKNNYGGDFNAVCSVAGKDYKLESYTGFAVGDIPLGEGIHKMRVKNKSNKTIYIRVSSSGIPEVGQEIENKQGFTVSTKYISNGREISYHDIKQGTSFNVQIKVTNNSLKNLKNIALTQYIPSGWEFVNTNFAQSGTSDNQIEHTEIRDDRANVYFSLLKGQTKTFVLKLNASYKGKYYLAGVSVQAMDDNRFNYKEKGKWIEVK